MVATKRPLCPKCEAQPRHKRATRYAPYCLPCNRIAQRGYMKNWRGAGAIEARANHLRRVAFLTINAPLTIASPI